MPTTKLYPNGDWGNPGESNIVITDTETTVFFDIMQDDPETEEPPVYAIVAVPRDKFDEFVRDYVQRTGLYVGEES